MFFGISHIVLPVTDLERAVRMWSGVVGFTQAHRGDGYVDIDSGNVALRLMRVPAVEAKLSLRLTVHDVGQAHQALVAAGAVSRYAPMKTPELEEMACVTDPDGHSIVLWRALTEDEWGFVPELPKQQGEWTPEAEDLLQRLLSHVPALFRMLARRKTTRVIEMMAAEENSAVTRELVIKGYITSSAKVTRYRLIEPLRAEGINPDDYRAEFDYE
jgi:catechol 2,3-dioxygenase-like lactoylglutathione lyase family enzyme